MGELIAGPQLPGEQALFGVVKFRLRSENPEPRHRGEKVTLSVVGLEAARGCFFRKLLEDVL